MILVRQGSLVLDGCHARVFLERSVKPGYRFESSVDRQFQYRYIRLACLHNHSASAMNWDCVSSRRQGFEVWVDDWSEAYDIASALVYYKFPWVWDEEPCFDYQELEAALLVGYASERPIPENLGQALPICFAARLLVLVQWILDVLDDVDATSFSRKSIANSIVHLRQFCRDNADHQS